MRSERLLGIAAPFVRGLPVLGFGVLAAGALAVTLQSHRGNPAHKRRAPFELLSNPGAQTISAGATARYWITIRRDRYDGPIWLTATPSHGLLVDGSRAAPTGGGVLPTGWAGAPTAGLSTGRRGLQIWVYRRWVLVEVRTDPRGHPGRYFVRFRAVGGHYRSVLKLSLVIAGADSVPFRIDGNFGKLWPGTSQSVNVLLTNPNGRAISVSSLTMGLRSVSAPRSSGALPCSTGDFVVTQFAGAYPLELPAHATRRLSDLDVPALLWPRVTMLNRPVNQDGCRGATVTVGYSGKATAP